MSSRRLELTQVEANLRRLLLDVASYIDPKSPSELRFTGGWVRDKLLGVGSHDIDVAINNMTGYQFGLKMKEYLEQPGTSDKYGLDGVATTEANAKSQSAATMVVAGLHKIEANPEKSKHLETVTTRIFGLDIDLVNLRKETYTEDSRNPQMEFGTPEEDALRRDATINAMFYNLTTEAVEDFTGQGHDDMRDKIIRTPLEPYQTFKDDPLRVLRLVRFASRLNYEIDEAAKKAMSEDSVKEALKVKISRERVGVELEKMLKGPDPRRALELIDELGLYSTTFTDITNIIDFEPDQSLWRPSYVCVSDLLSCKYPSNLKETLIVDTNHEYNAWVLSNFTPWIDAPTPRPLKPGGKTPLHMAVNAAREGIKADNKVSDVLSASLQHVEEITNLKDGYISSQKQQQKQYAACEDPSARDTLGMAIRKWGQTWRSQATFAFILEIARSPAENHQTIAQSWSSWLTHLTALSLLNAYDLRPIVDGKALSAALTLKPGPWMRSALDVVMAWQLANPTTATTEGAIAQVKAQQGEPLPALLIAHFLKLTIRPLFLQSSKTARVTEAGRRKVEGNLPERFVEGETAVEEERRTRVWKADPAALGILGWVVKGLTPEMAERHWPLLVPPLLALLDDGETKYKALGCELLTLLLAVTPTTLLSRTGLGPVFNDAITPCLSYLPTLTPEADSIPLMDAAYPALFALAAVRFPNSNVSSSSHAPSPYIRYLSSILHNHLLSSLTSTIELYPTLSATLLTHLQTIIKLLGVHTIAQLVHLFPTLLSILTNPFVAASPPLALQTTKTLQAIIATSWPRVWRWRADILSGVCSAWLAIDEAVGKLNEPEQKKAGKAASEDEKRRQDLTAVRGDLGVVVDMLVAAVDASGGDERDERDEGVDQGVNTGGEEEKIDVRSDMVLLVRVEPALQGLLGKHLARAASGGV